MGNSESGGDDGADWTTPKAVALIGLKNRTSGGAETYVGRSGLGARVRAMEKLNSDSSWILLVQENTKKIILKNPESNLFLRVKKKEELAAADGEWGGHSTIFFSVAPQDGSFFALQSSLGKFVTVDNTNVIANQQSAPSDVFSFQLVTMYNKALWDEIFKKK